MIILKEARKKEGKEEVEEHLVCVRISIRKYVK